MINVNFELSFLFLNSNLNKNPITKKHEATNKKII